MRPEDLNAIEKAMWCAHENGWEPFSHDDERCPDCLMIRKKRPKPRIDKPAAPRELRFAFGA